ncbi:uncharacterized protein [Dermacentor andersoni]|uniref:uncharacterized protein n=1 Tax=Dermacentor andersoni TaxID=34620 RepID=UPI003B3BE74C
MTVEPTSQPQPISKEADNDIDSERPTKFSALNGERESTVAEQARYEFHEMLRALSDSVKQLTKYTLGLGQCLRDCTRDFLRGRQASLWVGSLQSEPVELGDKGTPQDSVISPTLFNLAMIGLFRQLTRIGNLQHAIYVDDVTMWVAKRSEGQIKHTLQNAIRITEEYHKATGLWCSPSKSELPLYRPKRGGPKPKGWDTGADPCVHLYTAEGLTIPVVGHIKVLGMRIGASGSNTIAVAKLSTKAEDGARLLR